MATAPVLPPDNPDSRNADRIPTQGDNHVVSPITLLPPASLTRPLWKSLLGNVKDSLFPVSYPPLRLTSTPVNVITPIGELLGMPWYRTVFTNLGDVVAPETLPPLQLESRPVDVGELLSDQMSRPWWNSLLRSIGDRLSPEALPPLQLESRPMDVGELIGDSVAKPWWKSLLRNLADVLSPEKLPTLEISSVPINPGVSAVGLVLPHWSSVISVPTGMRADVPPLEAVVVEGPVIRRALAEPLPAPEDLLVPLEAVQVDADSVAVLVSQYKDNLTRSRRREIFWVCAISLELLVLLIRYLGWI